MTELGIKAPLISIIVPCYKVEQYLPRCVDSILNQTYKNLEIWLVDDGSPDKCGQILSEYADKMEFSDLYCSLVKEHCNIVMDRDALSRLAEI